MPIIHLLSILRLSYADVLIYVGLLFRYEYNLRADIRETSSKVERNGDNIGVEG
jgi:hypothetical protein